MNQCCGYCHQYRLFQKLYQSIDDSIDGDGKKFIIKSYYCSHNIKHLEFFQEYSLDFQINLFQICSMNFTFLLKSFLFTILFIILSLQTKFYL